MRNLLQETLYALKCHDKSPKDVLFVCDDEHIYTWTQFVNGARDYNYDDSYGVEEVETSLMVCGSDWWFERATYDGAEWWSFKTLPISTNKSCAHEFDPRSTTIKMWKDE